MAEIPLDLEDEAGGPPVGPAGLPEEDLLGEGMHARLTARIRHQLFWRLGPLAGRSVFPSTDRAQLFRPSHQPVAQTGRLSTTA